MHVGVRIIPYQHVCVSGKITFHRELRLDASTRFRPVIIIIIIIIIVFSSDYSAAAYPPHLHFTEYNIIVRVAKHLSRGIRLDVN